MSASQTLIIFVQALAQHVGLDDADLLAKLSAVQTEADGEAKSISDLTARVTALEEAEAAVPFDPTRLQEAITGLETRTTTLEGIVDGVGGAEGLPQRLTDLETAVAKAPTTFDPGPLQTSIDGLTTRVGAIEKRNADDDTAAGGLDAGAGGAPDPAVITLTGSLNNLTVGVPFTGMFAGTGGSGTLQFSLASGAFPDGLSMAAGGQVTGTPTAEGSFAGIIQAHDANNNQGSTTFSGTVAAAAVVEPDPAAPLTVSGDLGTLTVGSAVDVTLSSTGTAPIDFEVTGGALPDGVVMNLDGEVSGTPTTAGPYSVTITATDSSDPAATGSLTISDTVAAAAA